MGLDSDRAERSVEESLRDCIHCGLCLSSCPTYLVLGTEADSPRGRIYLMRAYAEGSREVGPVLSAHLDTCLGCRACEAACPSGVSYGALLEEMRSRLEHEQPRPAGQRLARGFLLSTLTSPSRLSLALQGSRLLARVTGQGAGELPGPLRKLLSKDAAGGGGLSTHRGTSPKHAPTPEVTEAEGTHRYTVGLLTGCVMEVLFSDVNDATRRVLARNGCRVIAPPKQGCCGALHVHNGRLEEARDLARRLIDTFSEYPLDALIVNSAGCGSTLKEYGQLLSGDPAYAERAAALAAKVRDICEFLAEIDLAPFPSPSGPTVSHRVTYHDPCHLAHAQGIRSQPRELLRRLPGVELVELPESDLCCGSAGIYNLTQPSLARQLQERKLAAVDSTHAEVVATGNPGCLLWIEEGLQSRQRPVEVVHPVELLDRAYRGT
ncbi:MAG TPA: glycolate oxidase subunit GlcF [Armatimonadota bacterium]|jgi:glycolate oxidase iron-sulfur subunit